MSLWPLKISFRLNSDKELIKEIKIDSDSIVLKVLFSACQIFGIQDPYNHTLIYKKTKLSLLESLKKTNLVQGSIISLVKNSRNRESRPVAFSYKIYTDSGIKKFIGQYSESDFFITALQNIALDSGSFNPLKEPSKSPIISILDAKLFAIDLIHCSNFTLESLGLKGNYCVSISYLNVNEINADFHDMLDFNKLGRLKKPLEPLISVENEKHLKSKNQATFTENYELESENIKSESFDIQFTAYRVSKNTVSAPNLPDAFYELSRNEFLVFHQSFKNFNCSLAEKSFNSSKCKISQDFSLLKNILSLKFVFHDQVYIVAKFESNASVMQLFSFIKDKILDNSAGDIELWIGPPYHILKCSSNSLIDSGIKSSTRILVKCKQPPIYNRNLKFETE